MSPSDVKILIVDDEPLIRASIGEVLADVGYAVAEAGNAQEAIARLAAESFDIILMDVQMPGLDGVEALKRIAAAHPRIGVIMISAHGTIETAVDSMRSGAFDFLQKPFSTGRLKEVVANLAVKLAASGTAGLRGRTPGSFGAYTVVREVAAGGTATVYEATHGTLNRTAALKVLHPHLAKDPLFIQRFEREATIAASLTHPNIVSVFDFGVQDERYFIAMEYVDGRSLGEALASSGPLPAVTAAALGVKICAALEYAHGHGVLHRDVKPANILLTKAGQVKVADFGFSRCISDSAHRLTLTGSVAGTPQFMAPEQIEGEEPTFAADIFSLGIVLYLAVTGVLPFRGDSAAAVMRRIVEGDFTPPRRIDKSIPREVEDSIMGCLRRGARERFPSLARPRAKLERFLARTGTHALDKELSTLAAG